MLFMKASKFLGRHNETGRLPVPTAETRGCILLGGDSDASLGAAGSAGSRTQKYLTGFEVRGGRGCEFGWEEMGVLWPQSWGTRGLRSAALRDPRGFEPQVWVCPYLCGVGQPAGRWDNLFVHLWK